jgi:hypothetical protein
MNDLYTCFPGCSISAYPCFIEFRVLNEERFKALYRVLFALKEDKHALLAIWAGKEPDNDQDDNRAWRNTNAWLELFDKEASAYFWWPEPEEKEAQNKVRLAGAPSERLNNSERKSRWTLLSMIDAFKTGEYELVSCDMWTPDTAVLEFEPYIFPYGGTDCMKALVEAFGFQVIGEDDGTGYVQY